MSGGKIRVIRLRFWLLILWGFSLVQPTLACGSCGFGALDTAFPPLRLWLMLLIPTFLFLAWCRRRRRGLSLIDLLNAFVGGFVLFALAAIMLMALVIPGVMAYVLYRLLAQARSEDEPVRLGCRILLALYVATALWTYGQAWYTGPVWKLDRAWVGGHAYGLADAWAKELPIPSETLARMAVEGNANERRNAGKVFVARARLANKNNHWPEFQKEVDLLEHFVYDHTRPSQDRGDLQTLLDEVKSYAPADDSDHSD